MSLLRPIHISFDALAGVDGSARFSFGDTSSSLASVSGPIAARLAAEHPSRSTVEVHVRPLSSVPGTTEKRLSTSLKGIIERACVLSQNPRTLIQVVVQALSSRSTSALVASEINACSLALVNAGSIPMRGVVCAVAVGRRRVGDEVGLVLDPLDESKINGGGCFAFLFGVTREGVQSNIPPSKMIWTDYRAGVGESIDAREITQATELARKGAADVWVEIKKSLGGFSVIDEDEDSDTSMET